MSVDNVDVVVEVWSIVTMPFDRSRLPLLGASVVMDIFPSGNIFSVPFTRLNFTLVSLWVKFRLTASGVFLFPALIGASV